MGPGLTSTPGTPGGGQIHFVTPTNRWLGSIPLSTIDPLTLESLSTYVRPDPPRQRQGGDEKGGGEEAEEAEEEEEEDMKERTTNIAEYFERFGESSDDDDDDEEEEKEEEEGEIRRQLEQEHQRPRDSIPRYVHSLIQNRALRNPLTNTEIEGEPTFFVVLEPGKGGWWHEPWATATRPAGVQGFHSLVHQHYQQRRHQEHGTEKEGDGGGENGDGMEKEEEEKVQWDKGLRKERWRQGRIINLELEMRHEMDWRRWNRAQATFAAEAETAEDQRNAVNGLGRRKRAGRRLMRLKLGKDVTLLEPSERGLQLPRRVRSRSLSSSLTDVDVRHRGEKMSLFFVVDLHLKMKRFGAKTTVANNNIALGAGLYLSLTVQASAVLDDMELEDVCSHQNQDYRQEQEQKPSDADTIKKAGSKQHLPGRLSERRGGRMSKKWKRRLARVHHTIAAPSSQSPRSASVASSAAATASETGGTGGGGFSFLPWWDPDPQPFQMPSTKLSPFAISTLPEPVAKVFGGTSIYSRVHPPSKPHATTSNPAITIDISSTTTTETTPAGIPKNTAGCNWVPVKHGDRVAVMIGNSEDFLLFPSFQRLFLRSLSREDFEDRVARVNRIPCPVTAIVVTNGANGESGVEEQMREQGAQMQEELQRQQQHERERVQREVDVSAMEEGGGRQGARSAGRSSWMAWMSPHRQQNGTGDTTEAATITTTTGVSISGAAIEAGTRPPLPPSNESTTAFVTSSSIASSSSSARSVASATGEDSIGDEKRGRLDDNDDLEASRGNNTISSDHNGNVDTMDEKSAKRSKETREEEERRWQALEERFLREDYDSSEYSYASSSDEEGEELPLDYDGPYYSSEESNSGDDEYEYGGFGSGDDGREGSRRRQRRDAGHGSGSRPRWGIRDWLYFFTFCTPHPRTFSTTDTATNSGPNNNRSQAPLESRRARRRRLRREQWVRIQQRQREQESAALHLYLPLVIRQRMTAQDVHRVCMAAEFCRFYLTILMSIVIIGAIVYGAVHVEASPSPKAPKAPGAVGAHAKDWVVPASSGGSGQGAPVGAAGAGGGSSRKVPEQWTTSVEGTGDGGVGGVWQGVRKNESKDQQQQPLGNS
ncbi:hypothetical protein KI688_006815 [Linnemannia hyalina]|uniref:Uncharacterized protein n=1 Tax=Linnemannia hyalina TaxID=64524 RepID=A0A9P7XIV3_9FUNG|nr:hypothetical protein KI688_006815 [Linnemannia hyalina]